MSNKLKIPDPVIEKFQLENGEKGRRTYRVGKEIGRGSFSNCFEITNLET